MALNLYKNDTNIMKLADVRLGTKVNNYGLINAYVVLDQIEASRSQPYQEMISCRFSWTWDAGTIILRHFVGFSAIRPREQRRSDAQNPIRRP